MNKYSAWLLAERKRRNLTQEELAERCKAMTGGKPKSMASSTYAQVERGAREPSYELVVRIADGLGLTSRELVHCLQMAGLWLGPVTEDYAADWWIADCRRAARGADRAAIEMGVFMFEVAVERESKRMSEPHDTRQPCG